MRLGAAGLCAMRWLACCLFPNYYARLALLCRLVEPDRPFVVLSGSGPRSQILDFWKIRPEELRGRRQLSGFVRVLKDDLELEAMAERLLIFFDSCSPVVERRTDWQYFLDLSGFERQKKPLELAREIQERLRQNFAFEVRMGLGANKIMAWLAAWQAAPGSAMLVEPEQAPVFCENLSIWLLPVGNALKRELWSLYNIRTLADLRAFSRADLTDLYGREGRLLYASARGEGPERLQKTIQQEQLSCGRRFGEIVTDQTLRAALRDLTVDLVLRLKERKQMAGRVELRLVYYDDREFKRKLRPVKLDRYFLAESAALLEQALARRVGVRFLELRALALAPFAEQLSLFEKRPDVTTVVADLRHRFGKTALRYGRSG